MMTFKERIQLEQEYKEWIIKESINLKATIDKSSIMSFLVFLEHKGLLKERTDETDIYRRVAPYSPHQMYPTNMIDESKMTDEERELLRRLRTQSLNSIYGYPKKDAETMLFEDEKGE